MLRFQIKNGQVAFEFVLLVSVLFLAVIVFSSFVRDNFAQVRSDTSYLKLKDVALFVKSEIELASLLQDGYERDFFVPFTIDGLEYNITSQSTKIFFSSGSAGYSVTVPHFTGDLNKGNNVIRKIGGMIEVN